MCDRAQPLRSPGGHTPGGEADARGRGFRRALGPVAGRTLGAGALCRGDARGAPRRAVVRHSLTNGGRPTPTGGYLGVQLSLVYPRIVSTNLGGFMCKIGFNPPSWDQVAIRTAAPFRMTGREPSAFTRARRTICAIMCAALAGQLHPIPSETPAHHAAVFLVIRRNQCGHL